MEAELLKSKTELMLLNNQLLEAVQKRLELSLELEAWKVNLKQVNWDLNTLRRVPSVQIQKNK